LVQRLFTNAGKNARKAGRLGGDYDTSDADTPGSRWERTEFAGTHRIEAVIIKNGRCVAKSRPKKVRVRAGSWC